MRFKIGLLGGTFNPVHRGHVELGLNIWKAFGLEKILFILSARPPHKKGLEIVPVDIRWKMLQKALEPFPQLVPCDIEMKRCTDSWTIDTVAELTRQFPGNYYYFISGSEGFLKIRTWKNYKKLLNTLPFIVVLRKEADQPAVEKLLRDEGITCDDGSQSPKKHPGKSFVYIFTYQSDCLDISSTFIRKKIKLSGYEGIENFVGKEVKKIMEENNLYEEK